MEGLGDVVPFTEGHLPTAIPLCADGLRRTGELLGRTADTPAESTAERLLRGYLESADSGERRAWVVASGNDVRAFAGAMLSELGPDDDRFTYQPPVSVTVPVTAIHAGRGTVDDLYPLLYEEIERFAAESGDAHVLIGTGAADTATTTVWRRLGLRPTSTMALRSAATWRPSGAPTSVRVRVAAGGDVDAITELALEEHAYHAEHTSSGVSPNQSHETCRRLAAQSVGAAPDHHRQLVAETPDGRIVGCIEGSVQRIDDGLPQSHVLPATYGYIGMTVVTSKVRGSGIGHALLDAVMRWFSEKDVADVMLHYTNDNRLSSRFWRNAGFAPHIESYTRDAAPAAPGSTSKADVDQTFQPWSPAAERRNSAPASNQSVSR